MHNVFVQQIHGMSGLPHFLLLSIPAAVPQ